MPAQINNSQVVADAVRKAQAAKPKATSRRLKIGLGLLGLLLVAGAAVYFLWWLPTTAKIDAIFREVMIEGVCRDVYREDYRHLSVESFSNACEQEAQSALIGMEQEVDFCLDQSKSGTLEAQFIQCLVDNGFQFSGVWMSTAR